MLSVVLVESGGRRMEAKKVVAAKAAMLGEADGDLNKGPAPGSIATAPQKNVNCNRNGACGAHCSWRI